MEPLTNDQLVTLITNSNVPHSIQERANNEMLFRLETGMVKARPVHDPFDEIAARFDKVYEQIKDLHERYDQICKKLVELEHGKPSLKGSDFEGMPAASQNDDVFIVNTKAHASNPKTAIEAVFYNTEDSKYAPNCKMNVPHGFRIFKGNREVDWTDRDMREVIVMGREIKDLTASGILEKYRKDHENH
jgi:hypothetical protein